MSNIRPLRSIFDECRELGVTHFVFDLAKDSRNLTALTADGPLDRATRLFHQHKSGILAHMRVSGEPLSIDDVEARMGIIRDYGKAVTPIGNERTTLMAALGWPEATLTLEQLRTLVLQ
jgi:hypothetical protein